MENATWAHIALWIVYGLMTIAIGYAIGYLVTMLRHKLRKDLLYQRRINTAHLHICPRCNARIRIMCIPPLLSTGAPIKVLQAAGFACTCICTKGPIKKTEAEAFIGYLETEPEPWVSSARNQEVNHEMD